MVIAEMIECMFCVIRLYRSAENTNQRILFDIDPSGQHLGTGGQVSVFLFFCLAKPLMFNQYPFYVSKHFVCNFGFRMV